MDRWSSTRGRIPAAATLSERIPGLIQAGQPDITDGLAAIATDRSILCDLRPPFERLSNEPPMFVFISHLNVPPGDHESLERHFRERSRLVDGFPGFLYLQLMKPERGDATHAFLTAWEDRDSFRRYMRSQEHAHSHSREPGEIMGRTEVSHQAFEVIMDSRTDPEWLRPTEPIAG